MIPVTQSSPRYLQHRSNANRAAFFIEKGERLKVNQDQNIHALELAWRALEERASGLSIFQTYDWCRAWISAAESAGAPEEVRILTIRAGQDIILLWPFAIRRFGGARILHTLGEPASQYSDVLICPQYNSTQLIEKAWNYVRSWDDIDVIELRRVRENTALAKFSDLKAYCVPRSSAEAPCIDFSKLDSCDPLGARSSKSRNSLRRHERHLSQHGAVSFSLIRDVAHQRRAVAEVAMLKRAWMQDKAMVSAGYAHPANASFIDRLASEGLLCGAQLCVGSDTAAIELGMQRAGVYWSLIQSYNLRFAKHAPGRILFRDFLAACPNLGIRHFDFLAPAQKHKIELSTGKEPIVDYIVPKTIRGCAVAAYLGWLRPALKNLYELLPVGARRLAAQGIPRFGIAKPMAEKLKHQMATADPRAGLRRLLTWNGDFLDWMLVVSCVWIVALYLVTSWR
jgi:CelD/BcsL family acetyltransferase involved in cellulose biosynthesis